MAGNAQGMDSNRVATTYAEEEEKQLVRIQQLAAMPEEQAIKAIQEQADREVGKYGTEAVVAVERNLAQIVARYKEEHAVHVTGFADVLVREKVATNVNVDAKGNTSYGASGQVHAGQVGDVKVFAGGSVGFDQSGVTGGSAWVNGIGKPIEVGGVHAIPVSQVAVNVPADDNVRPENVTGMVGAVINPNGINGNIAALASATMDGKTANAFVDYSHDIALGKGVIATPHAGVTQQFMGDQGTSLSGGVRFHDPHMIDKTTGLAFEVTAGSSNLREKDPSWNVGAQVEVTFEAKKESPLEQAFMHATGKTEKVAATDLSGQATERGARHLSDSNTDPSQQQAKAADSSDHSGKVATQSDDRIHTTISPHANVGQNPMQAKLDHFYELSTKEQRAVVDHMANTYVKHHPDVNKTEAHDIVLNQILNPNKQNDQQQNNHHEQVASL